MNDDLQDLISHIAQQEQLSQAAAQRLVGDVLAYLAEPVEAYVARRHGELVSQGLKNRAIFERLVVELRQRPFAAPELSVRQIRRLIYG